MSDKGNPEKDKIDTGGAAFPEDRIERGGDSAYTKLEKVHDSGMTLLDYFAGQALVGFLNHPVDLARLASKRHLPEDRTVATASYEMAQAMIAEKRRLEAW